MSFTDTADDIIDRNLFRKDVFDLIPDASRRILDFGCNEGELLLRLRRDKGCEELYGLDVMERVRPSLEEHLDGGYIADLHNEDLPEELKGFFETIVMHDVLEHLYDPWYVLGKLRNHLAVGGRLLCVVPNFQFWGLWGQVFNGNFHYGRAGGLMNEEHIRWFTQSTLTELIEMAGLELVKASFQFPPAVDQHALLARLRGGPITELCLPPPECGFPTPQVTIKFGGDIRDSYAAYLANKIVMTAERKSAAFVEPVRTDVGTLEKRREEMRAAAQLPLAG